MIGALLLFRLWCVRSLRLLSRRRRIVLDHVRQRYVSRASSLLAAVASPPDWGGGLMLVWRGFVPAW